MFTHNYVDGDLNIESKPQTETKHLIRIGVRRLRLGFMRKTCIRIPLRYSHSDPNFVGCGLRLNKAMGRTILNCILLELNGTTKPMLI